MEMRDELGLIGTLEDDDGSEVNAPEEDSDDEVTVGLLHIHVLSRPELKEVALMVWDELTYHTL